VRRAASLVAWSNQAILNEQGQIVEFFIRCNDTRYKQAEEALQRSETKFRNIFENSQIGIFRNRISDGLILKPINALPICMALTHQRR